MADTKISAASRLTGTGVVKRPVALSGSTAAFALADNYEATTNPGVGDDDADGFSIGSIWRRKDTGESWFCRDASTGAAVWCKQPQDSLRLSYLAGNHYPTTQGTVGNGSVLLANRLRAYPFSVRSRVTISDLYIRVQTVASGGNVQLAIYEKDPSTNRPTGNPIAVTGNISTTSSGNILADITGSNVVLEPGRIYWAAAIADTTAGATAVFQTVVNSDNVYLFDMGSPTLANAAAGGTSSGLSLEVTHTFGTWPDLTSGSFTETVTNYFLMHFKVASVP